MARPALVAALTALVLTAMIAAYAFGAGTMALRRHWNLESQALDMGYADQITWNMTQGRLFRFTVFRGDTGTELGQPLQFGARADRDSLFAFHVELLFLPLALLYLVWPGPAALTVLLTAVLALGAVPAYLLARRLLGSRAAALGWAAVYLLYPSVQAANLSDFHLVSMAPTVLLLGLYFAVVRRYRAFAVTAVLAALLKEEVGLLVAAIGLYLWLSHGQRRLGAAVAGASLAWVALCFLVVIPHFNGGAPSPFSDRYANAIRHVAGVPGAWLAGQPEWPVPGITVGYLQEMLASSGYLAVLAPVPLLVAVPALAINGLSSSAWQHGGGAHYSAEAVPGILLASISAVRWLSGLGWRRLKLAPATGALALTLVALGAALLQSGRHGLLPPASRFSWPQPNGRLAALQPLLDRIPAGAPVSAQSNLFPHLSQRERIYVFPAVEDARYVLVDVAGTSAPLLPADLRWELSALLAEGEFRLLDGRDGFLLLERRSRLAAVDAAPGPAADPLAESVPPSFASFARPAPAEPHTRAFASFGGLFELAGYRLDAVPEVHFFIRRARPVLFVRALRPAEHAYRTTALVIDEHWLSRPEPGGNATEEWHPTDRWRPGEVVKLRYPALAYRPGEQLGVRVALGAGDGEAWLPAASAALPVIEEEAIVVLGRLP